MTIEDIYYHMFLHGELTLTEYLSTLDTKSDNLLYKKYAKRY